MSFDIQVKNIKIERIFSFNLLGVTLDEYLNFNSYMNENIHENSEIYLYSIQS